MTWKVLCSAKIDFFFLPFAIYRMRITTSLLWHGVVMSFSLSKSAFCVKLNDFCEYINFSFVHRIIPQANPSHRWCKGCGVDEGGNRKIDTTTTCEAEKSFANYAQMTAIITHISARLVALFSLCSRFEMAKYVSFMLRSFIRGHKSKAIMRFKRQRRGGKAITLWLRTAS